MKWMITLLLLILAILSCNISDKSHEGSQSLSRASGEKTAKSSRTKLLKKELSYLKDYDEISWIDIDGNDVYIGFNEVPPDLSTLLRSIALNGNKAINFGVHVWAVDANEYSKGWRPGDGSYYEEVTARYGKIE